MTRGARTLVLATLLAPLACSDQGPETALLNELQVRRATWSATRPYAYEYVVARSCFCAPESLGPVRVEVEGDVVVRRTYAESGEPVPEHLAHFFPTVDGVFAILYAALATGAHEVVVQYDPGLGFPEEVWIDYVERMADDEIGLSSTLEVPAAGG